MADPAQCRFGAGNAADEGDLVQDRTIQFKSHCRFDRIADHDDLAAGLDAVDASRERARGANNFECNVKAAARSLLHHLGTLRIVAVEVQINVADFFSFVQASVVDFGEGNNAGPGTLCQRSYHQPDNAVADDKHFVVKFQTGTQNCVIGHH